MLLREISFELVFLVVAEALVLTLILADQWLAARSGGQVGNRRWLFFWGLVVFSLLAIITAIAAWNRANPSSLGPQLAVIFAIFALAPILSGALVVLLLNWRSIAGLGRGTAAFLLPLGALLVVLAFINFSSLLALLVGVLLLALLWHWGQRVGNWLAVPALLVLVTLQLALTDVPLLDIASTSGLPGGLVTLVNIGLIVLFLLLYALPALLLFSSLRPGKALSWRAAAPRLIVVLLILFEIIYLTGQNAFWASAQNRIMEDNFPFQIILLVFFGLMLAIFLSGRRRLVGVAYVLLVPTLVVAAFVVGWGTSNVTVTEGRAQAVSQALERYHQHNGYYPTNLVELTPRYLLRLPAPAGTELDRSWCFQGGEDYFRLGYVSAQFNFPYRMPVVSVQVYKSAGNPPQSGWTCDQKAAAVESAYSARYLR